MDIYSRLKQDHDKQRDLGAQLSETHGDSAEREKLWHAYKIELEAHASAEEQTFYAELMSHPEASDQARHSVSEHKEMADLVEELDGMEMSSPGWLQKFKSLRHEVEHHVDEEEDEVFPMAKALIAKDAANVLASAFNERKPAEIRKEQDDAA